MTFIPNVQTSVDNNNSTTTLLTANSQFIGIYTNILVYNTLVLTINSDIDGKIQVMFSSDGITDDITFKDTYLSNTQYVKNFQIVKKYYKIVYTNGLSNQTVFNMSSMLSINPESTTVVYDENFQKHSNDFQLDSFGKLRVTNPLTLLDIKFPSGNGTTQFKNNTELVCSKATGSGSGVYGSSKCILSVTTNGDSYINQSRKYCTYQPGKSLLFLGSGILNSGSNSPTVTSRIGYFDDNNGFFFQYNGTLSICLRNATTDTYITQANWNIDKMDGYGPSGLNIDVTKAILVAIDFEWLGVGRIRYGFYANGIINYCHQITNENTLSSGPYCLTASLPVRYEIFSSGAGGAGSLTQICSTVISEGGYNPIGKSFSASSNTTTTSVNGTETPLFAIKGISTYNHENILPTGISLLDITNNSSFLYKLRLFQAPATDPGTFVWNNVNNNSVTRYAIAPTAVTLTNSIILDQGYIYGKSNIIFGDLSSVFNNINQITSDINGNSDILLVTGQLVSGGSSVDIVSAMTWQEIY